MKTYTVTGQRYDYSRFPIARVAGHRQALAEARKSLHCSRLKKLSVASEEEAYTSLSANEDDIEAVVLIAEVR